jgi:hypothetical protein
MKFRFHNRYVLAAQAPELDEIWFRKYIFAQKSWTGEHDSETGASRLPRNNQKLRISKREDVFQLVLTILLILLTCKKL